MASYKVKASRKEDIITSIGDLASKIETLELPGDTKKDLLGKLVVIELDAEEIIEERDDLEEKVDDLEDEVEDLEKELEEFEDITLYRTKTIEGNPSSYSEDVLRTTLMGIWRDRHLVSTDKNKMSIIESVARM